jgi:hypothetical protein
VFRKFRLWLFAQLLWTAARVIPPGEERERFDDMVLTFASGEWASEIDAMDSEFLG